MSVFNTLGAVNVSGMTENKQGLTYLTWTHAWSETCKKYPSATYEIKKFENNLPYVYDQDTGYMVFTTVTIEGLTHEMWLFVMDGANKAMKAQPYTYSVKDYNESKRQGKYVAKQKGVDSASMFDINKTIMRCLVKNLAMHGLGLNIYAGEDLPTVPQLPSIEEVKGWIANGQTKESCMNHVANTLGCEITEEFKKQIEAL